MVIDQIINLVKGALDNISNFLFDWIPFITSIIVVDNLQIQKRNFKNSSSSSSSSSMYKVGMKLCIHVSVYNMVTLHQNVTNEMI